MTTYASQPNGHLNSDELDYIEHRAKDGFGMVMTAACKVHWSGHAFYGQWSCESDEFIADLEAMAERIRRHGGKSVLQIHHGGRQCPSALVGGPPWSASAVPSERPNAEVPHAMEEGEIQEVVGAFGAAASRAERAGFDMVEIHGANTYLLQQFVSPHSNRRTDEWGEDRLKFSRDVLRACRVACSIPIGYRLSPEEAETPGIRLSDTQALVDMLCTEGVEWIDVSLRRYDQPSLHDPSSGPLLKLISEWVGGRTVVMGGGGVTSLEAGLNALSLGADLVYVGRAAITEPGFLTVVSSGRSANMVVPSQAAEEKLVLPKGLAEKIYSTPGWFQVAQPAQQV